MNTFTFPVFTCEFITFYINAHENKCQLLNGQQGTNINKHIQEGEGMQQTKG